MTVAFRKLPLVTVSFSFVMAGCITCAWAQNDSIKKLETLQKDLDRLRAESKAEGAKLPSNVGSSKTPQPSQPATETEAAKQKGLALERLQRNLEDQRRQRLDDILVIRP